MKLNKEVILGELANLHINNGVKADMMKIFDYAAMTGKFPQIENPFVHKELLKIETNNKDLHKDLKKIYDEDYVPIVNSLINQEKEQEETVYEYICKGCILHTEIIKKIKEEKDMKFKTPFVGHTGLIAVNEALNGESIHGHIARKDIKDYGICIFIFKDVKKCFDFGNGKSYLIKPDNLKITAKTVKNVTVFKCVDKDIKSNSSDCFDDLISAIERDYELGDKFFDEEYNEKKLLTISNRNTNSVLADTLKYSGSSILKLFSNTSKEFTKKINIKNLDIPEKKDKQIDVGKIIYSILGMPENKFDEEIYKNIAQTYKIIKKELSKPEKFIEFSGSVVAFSFKLKKSGSYDDYYIRKIMGCKRKQLYKPLAFNFGLMDKDKEPTLSTLGRFGYEFNSTQENIFSNFVILKIDKCHIYCGADFMIIMKGFLTWNYGNYDEKEGIYYSYMTLSE